MWRITCPLVTWASAEIYANTDLTGTVHLLFFLMAERYTTERPPLQGSAPEEKKTYNILSSHIY